RGILWFSHKIAPYSVGCPTFGVQSSSAAGHGLSQGAACMPGGGYGLPGLQTALEPTIALDP
ncbi:hypothetical protein, partial [Klebsiella pneumoniae]|uniref:hypothetical protein n=1 Tax=Klebsiella pneumoniae TaxID=573 RepID=UPI001CA33DE2